MEIFFKNNMASVIREFKEFYARGKINEPDPDGILDIWSSVAWRALTSAEAMNEHTMSLFLLNVLQYILQILKYPLHVLLVKIVKFGILNVRIVFFMGQVVIWISTML